MTQTAPPDTRTTNQAAETWRTRPETTGTFIGNLALSALLPFLLLWFMPRYTMRREYGKALACVAVAVAWALFVYFFIA